MSDVSDVMDACAEDVVMHVDRDELTDSTCMSDMSDVESTTLMDMSADDLVMRVSRDDSLRENEAGVMIWFFKGPSVEEALLNVRLQLQPGF